METLFFRRPRLVALVVLVLVAAGASAFVSIARQEDPTITNLFATVTTLYPGAEPARVEALVSAKIETELAEVAAIDTVESRSASGLSIVDIELVDTLDAAAIEASWTDVRDALDEAELEFPAGALAPEVLIDGVGTYGAIVALVPEPGTTLRAARRHATRLAEELRRVGGTESVALFGEPDEEVLVTLEPVALADLGLDVAAVSTTIERADAKVSAGRVRVGDGDWLVELDGEIDALERLRAVPLVADGAAAVRLGDVATVGKGTRAPPDELAFDGGRAALLVAASVVDGRRIDRWMDDVTGALERFETTLPGSIGLRGVFDQSRYTDERLAGVGRSMGLGIALVVLVLLVTLGPRAALIVATVLPLVTLASIATLSALGVAIQQMSLTGMIVALGLLVDAAIVMTDEIRRRLADGARRLEAVRSSVRRLFAPLLASTLTTALAFMPMVLLPGPPGDFVGSIAVAVIVMLGWSFALAISVTAALAGWLLPAAADEGRGPERGGGGRAGGGIRAASLVAAFGATMRLALRRPASAVAFALVLPLTGLLSLPTLTAQFFPGVDRDQFHVEVELAPGSAIDATRRTALAIDARLRATEGVERVSWVVGKSLPAFYYNFVGDRDREPAFAQALVTSASAGTTAALVPRLQDALGAEFREARVTVRALVQGPPVGAPVELRLVGPSLEVLRAEGERLRRLVGEVDGVTLVRTSFGDGAPKVVFDVDEDEARVAGLDLGDVAGQLETMLEGRLGGSLLDGGEELPVRVRVGRATLGDLDAIANLPLVPPGAERAGRDAIPLGALAELSLAPAQGEIGRRDGERVNTVQAHVRHGVLPEEALDGVRSAMTAAGYAPPDGYELQIGGDADMRSDTLANLLAPLGLIVTLAIASIALTLDSFRLTLVTLVVAVLCAGLSLLSLAVFRHPFGINAIIGVIGSVGVSINAAIIVMTALQRDPAARAGDVDAMARVVVASGRHIVSTTATTVGGFLPLVLAGGQFWPPFATALAGGVLLSTVVSFWFVPPAFRIVYARAPRLAPDATPRPPGGGTGDGAGADARAIDAPGGRELAH